MQILVRIITQYCCMFTFKWLEKICKMLEKFCVKWGDFQESVISTFGSLRKSCDFADVTLACEDGKQQVEAHKVILAASSPFFQKLLQRNIHPHPIVFMRGVSAQELEGNVDFLYYGEANVIKMVWMLSRSLQISYNSRDWLICMKLWPNQEILILVHLQNTKSSLKNSSQRWMKRSSAHWTYQGCHLRIILSALKSWTRWSRIWCRKVTSWFWQESDGRVRRKSMQDLSFARLVERKDWIRT